MTAEQEEKCSNSGRPECMHMYCDFWRCLVKRKNFFIRPIEVPPVSFQVSAQLQGEKAKVQQSDERAKKLKQQLDEVSQHSKVQREFIFQVGNRWAVARRVLKNVDILAFGELWSPFSLVLATLAERAGHSLAWPEA